MIVLPAAAGRAGLLLLRHWKLAAMLLIAGAIALRLHLVTVQRDDARAALVRERAAHALFAARVRARAEEVARRFAEHARRVERDQGRISQEMSRDYQERIADVHRRAAALRLRTGTAGADPGRAGTAGMPALSGAATGPDAAAGDPRLPLEERVVATEQAIRLDALQRWVRAQAARRPPVP
jgi:hypothetical protein